VVPILVIIVGLGFGYLIALEEDAPGVIFLVGTISLACATLIYGLGELIVSKNHQN
jgi:hypothetical protein